MYESSDGWGCGGMYAGTHACTCMNNTGLLLVQELLLA